MVRRTGKGESVIQPREYNGNVWQELEDSFLDTRIDSGASRRHDWRCGRGPCTGVLEALE